MINARARRNFRQWSRGSQALLDWTAGGGCPHMCVYSNMSYLSRTSIDLRMSHAIDEVESLVVTRALC
jgi:hypothetical protein